jgi:putative FmdB family regulatory protein
MPVYEYQCNACSDRFELRRKFSDDPVKECPKCGGEVTKLISSAAFSLRGGAGMRKDTATKKAPKRLHASPAGVAQAALQLRHSLRITR